MIVFRGRLTVSIGDLRLSASTRSSARAFAGSTLSHHIPISSHELPSLPKTNMKSEGCGNVNGLNFENCPRSQSRTHIVQSTASNCLRDLHSRF